MHVLPVVLLALASKQYPQIRNLTTGKLVVLKDEMLSH